MELRVLRYFLMAAQEGNLTRAANRLHVSQPTLSRQLMQLEEELGVSLFTRTSHAMQLTSAGRQLVRRAQEIVDLHDKTVEAFHMPADMEGMIGIGSGEFASFECLAAWLAEFHEEYPGAGFNFFTGSSEDILERMEAGLLDLGLLMDPPSLEGYEQIQMPVLEQWCFMVPRNLPIARKKVLHPADLEGMDLAGARRPNMQSMLKSWMGSCCYTLQVFTNLPYNASSYCGRSGIPFFTLKLPVVSSQVIPVAIDPEMTEPTVLVWKNSSLDTPLMKTLLAFLQKKAAQ